MLLKDKKVFFVEDDRSNIAIIKTILEQNGATVAFERWGKDSIDRLRKFAPVDIILLDLMISATVTGFDLIEEIHKIPDFADTPVVAVSAADPTIAMKQARDAGFQGFISKPVRWGLFEKQIASLIDGDIIWHAE